jgi:hypothetical protein
MREIFAVQHFTEDEMWRTAYVSTYRPDAEVMYREAQQVTARTVRLVSFTTDSLDFIAIHARGFAVLDVRL